MVVHPVKCAYLYERLDWRLPSWSIYVLCVTKYTVYLSQLLHCSPGRPVNIVPTSASYNRSSLQEMCPTVWKSERIQIKTESQRKSKMCFTVVNESLHTLFQLIRETEKYTSDWNFSILSRFPKKGDKTMFWNYASISLLDAVAKAFTQLVLNCCAASRYSCIPPTKEASAQALALHRPNTYPP